ncbi:hypothetical protein DF016_36800 [Burkholderia stagnalis]|uniref:Uncharacterized protein n=1 Tax=Burkholderia stagnalis TaxID=1503054 RepID=A0ABX9YC46_9BURK|nr:MULTISPECIES: hypothetical protein [Burkholderia]MDD1493951.1 hypothetical protein [Burkholderia thailandensis]RQY77407.1 hypothetical protein DF017_36845 [Burkholderia stagnalis]RQZ03749.1 hypothetical protein DF016_36800 [Burkholderia stagnalis]
MSVAALETTVHDAAGVVLRYRLKHTGQSSDRLGACEVCNRHASEVFHLTGAMLYERAAKPDSDPGRFGWTHHKCVDVFGHRDCVTSRRAGTLVMSLPDDRGDPNFRAVIGGVDVLIGRDAEGFKVYIADRYEAVRSTLLRAYRFAEEAVNHPERRQPITRLD